MHVPSFPLNGQKNNSPFTLTNILHLLHQLRRIQSLSANKHQTEVFCQDFLRIENIVGITSHLIIKICSLIQFMQYHFPILCHRFSGIPVNLDKPYFNIRKKVSTFIRFGCINKHRTIGFFSIDKEGSIAIPPQNIGIGN